MKQEYAESLYLRHVSLSQPAPTSLSREGLLTSHAKNNRKLVMQKSSQQFTTNPSLFLSPPSLSKLNSTPSKVRMYKNLKSGARWRKRAPWGKCREKKYAVMAGQEILQWASYESKAPGKLDTSLARYLRALLIPRAPRPMIQGTGRPTSSLKASWIINAIRRQSCFKFPGHRKLFLAGNAILLRARNQWGGLYQSRVRETECNAVTGYRPVVKVDIDCAFHTP